MILIPPFRSIGIVSQLGSQFVITSDTWHHDMIDTWLPDWIGKKLRGFFVRYILFYILQELIHNGQILWTILFKVKPRSVDYLPLPKSIDRSIDRERERERERERSKKEAISMRKCIFAILFNEDISNEIVYIRLILLSIPSPEASNYFCMEPNTCYIYR